jgi:hypothetical protein
VSPHGVIYKRVGKGSVVYERQSRLSDGSVGTRVTFYLRLDSNAQGNSATREGIGDDDVVARVVIGVGQDRNLEKQ